MRHRNELVRFAKTAAQAMRNANTGNPDAVQVSVRGQHTDGRYIVRRDHWPMDILVPSSPRDAAIPYPRRMPMGFEDGSQQKPVLYWLQRRVTAVASPLGLPVAVLTANWRCQHGDFQRRNSYTSATFAFADLEPKTSLADLAGVDSCRLPRFHEGFSAWVSSDYRIVEPEDVDYDEGIGGGDSYQLGPWLFRTIPSDPEVVQAHNLATDLPEGLVTDWLTFSADTLAILDSGEIVLGWAHTFEETTTDFLTIFPNDDTIVHRKTCVITGLRRREGADTVAVGDYLCTPVYDELTFLQEEFVHVWQISTETTDAELVDLTGADSYGAMGPVWPNPEPTCPQSWVGSDRLILQDRSGGLYGIDPTTPGIDWMYGATKAVRPLAVNGSTLVCAYENLIYDTVTDTYESIAWDGTGGTIEDRAILAAGKSTVGGILYLSCATGSEGSVFEFPGEESNGNSLGPLNEVRTSHTGSTYTSPEWTLYDPGDTGWFSGWGGPMISMRNAVLVDGTVPEAPGESETYPYATADWANELYESINNRGLPPVGGTGTGATWIATVTALFNEERELLVREAFNVLAAQPGPEYYIKKELWRNTWSSLSRTNVEYDDLHSVLSGSTYFEPPAGSGSPVPVASIRSIPSNYEGTEEAASIADTEQPNVQGDFTSGSWWIHGLGNRTYSWELIKVWSNVQEEIPHTATPSPLHALGPATIGLGLIVMSPPAATGINTDAHWVGRSLTNPSAPAWTFSVAAEPDAEVLTGNTWMDSGRVWVEYNTGDGWQLVGLLPDTGLPDEADPDIPLDSGNVVFDGTNVHGENCEWALGPA